MHVLSASLRCGESVLLSLLVMLALAAVAAGANPPAEPPLAANREVIQRAHASVAELERDLDHESSEAISQRVPSARPAEQADEVMSQAKQFYSRLMSQPLHLSPAPGGRDSSSVRQIADGLRMTSKTDAYHLVLSPSGSLRLNSAKDLVPTSAQPTRASRLVLDRALAYRGTPYRWGGANREGLDCSGLVLRVLSDLGRRVPHSAALLFGLGQPVGNGELHPGDLVFFRDTYKPGISHVGIFDEGSQFVHASNAAGQVTVGDMNRSYFRHRYAGARRLLSADTSSAPRQSLTFAGKVVTAPLLLGGLRPGGRGIESGEQAPLGR